MNIDGVSMVTIADSKIHGCDGWKTASRLTFKTETRQTLQGTESPRAPEGERGDSVLLNVEFRPPPVTPLSVVLSSK